MYGVGWPSHNTVWTRQPVSRSLEATRNPVAPVGRRRAPVREARQHARRRTWRSGPVGVNSSKVTKSGRSCSMPWT